MGCWNGTDALTQLAIRHREKTRLFFLIPHDGHKGEDIGGGYTYPDDFYEPFGLPLLGEYDDGGCIENIERDLNTEFLEQWFLKQFKDGAILFSERYKDLRKSGLEPEITESDMTIEKIVALAERGYLRMHPRYSREEKPITMMLVLDSVYNSCLKHANKFKERWGTTLMKDKVEAAADKYFGHLKSGDKRFPSKSKADDPEEWDRAMKTSFECDRARDEFWSGGHSNLVLRHDYIWWLEEQLKLGRADIFETAKTGLIDYVMFTVLMHSGRKAFVPQCGAGSQDDDIEIQKMLADTVNTICKKRKKEYA